MNSLLRDLIGSLHFHSLHVLKMLANEGNLYTLQLPAPAIASTNNCVVCCLIALLTILILAQPVFYYLLGHIFTCTITTPRQERQCYVSIIIKIEDNIEHKY